MLILLVHGSIGSSTNDCCETMSVSIDKSTVHRVVPVHTTLHHGAPLLELSSYPFSIYVHEICS